MNNLDQYKNEILSQYQQGGSILGLSKSYECNYRTMKKFLEANGVETRGLTGNGKMEKYKDRIFELYNQGLACPAIGKEVGFDRHLIQKFLERHGIDYQSRKPNRASKDKEQMLKLRQEGKNSVEIAKELGYEPSFIRTYLKQFGLKFEKDLYSVDVDFFKKIDTEAKAFTLGWWITDGCVTKNRICLKITDRDILERIKEEMKYEGPLLINRPKPAHHKLAHILSISRTEMANDLIALGCGINKTFNVKFPSTDIVPEHLVRHFVRSCLEGDGVIYSHKDKKDINVGFVGTKELLEGINVFANSIDTNFRLTRRHPEKNTYQLRMGGNIQVLRFLDHIYKDATIYLERKYKIYSDFRCNYFQRKIDQNKKE